MKKILACTLALSMTAAMLTACGDSSSSSSSKADAATTTTTTTEATTTTTAATTEAAAEESSATESTAEGDGEATEAKDISEMPATLKSIDTASVTFKAGQDVSSFIYPMAEDTGNGAYIPNTDESKAEITVEELAGVPMVRVQTLDHKKGDETKDWGIPKIMINVAKLFEGHEEDLPKIFTVKADIVTKAVGMFTSDDGTEMLVPGNFMGGFATKPLLEDGSYGWNQLYEFGEAEWTSEWGSYELIMRPGIKDSAKFANTTEDQWLALLKWSMPNQADYYIADITFEDEDGNVLACNEM